MGRHKVPLELGKEREANREQVKKCRRRLWDLSNGIGTFSCHSSSPTLWVRVKLRHQKGSLEVHQLEAHQDKLKKEQHPLQRRQAVVTRRNLAEAKEVNGAMYVVNTLV